MFIQTNLHMPITAPHELNIISMTIFHMLAGNTVIKEVIISLNAA